MTYAMYICVMEEDSGRLKHQYRIKGKSLDDANRICKKILDKRRFKNLFFSPHAILIPDKGDAAKTDANTSAEKAKIIFLKNCMRYNLTKTEINLMLCKRIGGYHKETAANLRRKEGTIKTHLYKIYKKLLVNTCEDALAKLEGR